MLLGVGGTVLRGSIDLLVERDGAPPLVVDYKTDRLDGADPAERAAHYEIQRSIYALAVAEALGAAEVEVAYVFLERPEEPVLDRSDPRRWRRPRRAGATIAQISAASSRSPPEDATGPLPRLPGARRLCSGPRAVELWRRARRASAPSAPRRPRRARRRSR